MPCSRGKNAEIVALTGKEADGVVGVHVYVRLCEMWEWEKVDGICTVRLEVGEMRGVLA